MSIVRQAKTGSIEVPNEWVLDERMTPFELGLLCKCLVFNTLDAVRADFLATYSAHYPNPEAAFTSAMIRLSRMGYLEDGLY
jgi:hypothetical protein